jgi:hypothetical protein
MMNGNDLSRIINRIASSKHTDEDIAILCQVLLSGDDRQLSIQLGKYNVNITEGKEIHIGDCIYQQWDKEGMEALVKAIQETSGIYQNTKGGDAAGRDIDKRNIYENCTFIQLFTQGSKLSSFFQESFQDLDFSGISSESIQKAYQDFLPPDADLWDLPPPADLPDLTGNNIKAILKKLDGFRQLSQFLERLSQDQNLPIRHI